MKQLIQITTKLLLCLTCSFAHGSQTHSINLILAESEDLVFGDLDAVSVNDYLVFERNINGVKNIWSYHTINKTMTSLGVVDATRISGFRNQAAIETTANENDAVFITDGTPSGTSLLARKPELILESTQQAIYLLSPDFWNSRVYRYNGQSITEHDMRGTLVNNPNNKTNVCEFNDGSFEVLLNIRNFQGQINYTQFAGENVGFFSNDFLQIDNILGQCFVSVRYGPEYGNGTPGRLFYVFQPQGGLRSYGENEFVNSLANFT